MPRSKQPGFTLVEMLVVLFIIGVLAALILPAVHAARARARIVQCSNNLRQVGMGILQAAEAKGRFPAAGYWDGATRLVPMRSWVVDILPQLDQQNIADAWDIEQPYYDTVYSKNGPLSETHLNVLVCPDDDTISSDGGDLSYVVNGGFAFSSGDDCPTSYHLDGSGQATSGAGWVPMDLDGDGVTCSKGDRRMMELSGLFFYEDWPIGRGVRRFHTLAAIRDGLGQTILVSENLRTGYNRDFPIWKGNWASPWAGNCMFFGSGHVCPGGDCSQANYENANNRAAAPAADEAINAGHRLPEGSPWLSSYHRGGGVNVMLCDGSVRFLSQQVSGGVFAKLITPAGSYLPGGLRQSPLSENEF